MLTEKAKYKTKVLRSAFEKHRNGTMERIMEVMEVQLVSSFHHLLTDGGRVYSR